MGRYRRLDKKRKYPRHVRVCRLGAAVAFTVLLTAAPAFAFQSAETAIEELCGHMQGGLGGLLMSAAAVGGIAAAAFGNFRASFSFIITGIGAYTVSAMLSLYFPAAADTCTNGAPQEQGQGQGQGQGGGDIGGGDNGLF